MQFEFNIYDMLVFQSSDSSVYQDCVCEITQNLNRITKMVLDTNEEVKYNKIVKCTEFTLYLDDKNNVCKIINNKNNYKYKLKEIWTRADEDTYKRIWRK